MTLKELKDHYTKYLRNTDCRITYTKTNGDKRTAVYTLKDNVIAENWQPKTGSQKTKEPREDVLPVFDVEKLAWRSVKVENIEEFMALDPYSGIWVDETVSA